MRARPWPVSLSGREEGKKGEYLWYGGNIFLVVQKFKIFFGGGKVCEFAFDPRDRLCR